MISANCSAHQLNCWNSAPCPPRGSACHWCDGSTTAQRCPQRTRTVTPLPRPPSPSTPCSSSRWVASYLLACVPTPRATW